jgi:HTH-type transcriptional regulator/antitoxin HipB
MSVISHQQENMESARMIGESVRFHRRKAGLSQVRLANMAGVGKASVFDVEKGKETVQLDTLLKIFSVLNIQLELKSRLIGQSEHVPRDEATS